MSMQVPRKLEIPKWFCNIPKMSVRFRFLRVIQKNSNAFICQHRLVGELDEKVQHVKMHIYFSVEALAVVAAVAEKLLETTCGN